MTQQSTSEVALEKALEKVAQQSRRLASVEGGGPHKESEVMVLRTLQDSASIARMASLLSADDNAAIGGQ